MCFETNRMKTKCPNCIGDIQIHTKATRGDIVICSECKFSFEIVQKNGSKIQLVKAEPSSSDWGQ